MIHRGQKLVTSKTGRIYESKPVTIIMIAVLQYGERPYTSSANRIDGDVLFSWRCDASGWQFADQVDRPVGDDVKHIAEVTFGTTPFSLHVPITRYSSAPRSSQ